MIQMFNVSAKNIFSHCGGAFLHAFNTSKIKNNFSSINLFKVNITNNIDAIFFSNLLNSLWLNN